MRLKNDRAIVGCRFLLVVVPLAAAVAGACGTSSSVTTDPSPVKCQLSLTSPSSLDAAGGRGVFTVTTQPECAWDASTTADWISGLSPASGQGTRNVEFQVAPNEGTAPRDGDILVKDNRVHVSQRAPCRVELTPVSQIVSVNGGAGNVSVATASDCPWTASSSVSWLSLAPPVTGTGNGNVRFTLAPNAGADRVGAISVSGQVSFVTQSGSGPSPTPTPGPNPPSPGPTPPASCSYSLSGASQNVGAAGGGGGPVTVSAPSGCSWTSGSNASWISVTAGASGSGNGSVAFSVAPNTGGSRAGALTIAGQSFSVTQAACAYSVGSSSQNIGADGGAGSPISVSTLSACQWAASSSVSWIGITAGASGAGDGSVAFNVSPNTGGARVGTLTIASQTLTVSQAACSYSISPTSQSFSFGVNVAAPVSVSTLSSCQWSASSNASWLIITSATSGAGNGSVAFSVAANTGPPRSGTLTIAGQTETVTQGAPCLYGISPSDQTFGSGGGSGSIDVSTQSGCQSTSQSTVSWITVQSGVTNVGSGRVTYSVDANSGPARVGAIVIADQTFTVTQNGAGQ